MGSFGKQVSLLLSLVLLAEAGRAGTLQITAADIGGGKLAVGYQVTSGTTLPIGFALNITCTNGATFNNVMSTSFYFPIYPSTIDWATGTIDYGTPISPPSMPGTSGTGLGKAKVVVEMGVSGNPCNADEGGVYKFADLNRDTKIDDLDTRIFVSNWLINASAPDWAIGTDMNRDGVVNFLDYSILVEGRANLPPLNLSQLIVLQLNGNGAAVTSVMISGETTYRGGIVGDDGNIFSVQSASVNVAVPEPATLLLFGLGAVGLRRKHCKKIKN